MASLRHDDRFAHVEAFVQEHRGCGQLEGDTGEPGPLGYGVAIRCSCGARLDRWVTVEMAEHELRAGAGLPERP